LNPWATVEPPRSEGPGEKAAGGSPRKPTKATLELYEKPPQDLIDFVEQRSKPIELAPLNKRPKGKR
jgi:hypothetical protein